MTPTAKTKADFDKKMDDFIEKFLEVADISTEYHPQAWTLIQYIRLFMPKREFYNMLIDIARSWGIYDLVKQEQKNEKCSISNN